MKYEAVSIMTFKERQNRFVATCVSETGEEITAHVKNTGRCKELLIEGVPVAVNYQNKPTRKTDYDLVAVKKKEAWFNIDSQLPNELVAEGIEQETVKFDILKGNIIEVRREYTYRDSRFDFFLQTDKGERLLVEVKGMTLEHDRVGSFPDAPSLRGLKHVETLLEAQKEGYLVGVLFVAQFEDIKYGTIHTQMQPALNDAFMTGMSQGLSVQVYNCQVTPDHVTIKDKKQFIVK
ncbi:MAG: DNA/RNA nuclease SfsA [Vagococcus sp.]